MKIVIVGGGTSAWMTAAAFCKRFPDFEVTLIKGDTPSGVGESTTPHFNQYLKFMGITDEVFLKNVRATYKSSSRFEDFSSLGEVFHYPNGQSVRTDITFHQWMQAKALFPNTPPFAEVFMPFVTIAEQGKLPLNHPKLTPYDLSKDRSFHLDAKSFIKFLETSFCKGVEILDSKVKSVRYDGQRIKHVVVERGPYDNGPKTVYGDLYIDCTGQAGALIGALSPWKDYEGILTDTALVTRTEYTNKEKQMVPYTNAKGMSAGWTWTIPTRDYVSRGYVFSSKFQKESDAAEEFGWDEYKVVKFSNGRRLRAWVGNCISIGISQGFIEPLESTGLFNTHHAILSLMDILEQTKLPTTFHRDIFNRNMSEHMDGWCEFVEAHYYYSKRHDTPFWRAVTEGIDYVGEAHQTIIDHVVSGEPFPHAQDPIVYIFAGSGNTNYNTRLMEFFGEVPEVDAWAVQNWSIRTMQVKELADQMPTMNSYLEGLDKDGGLA